jgi:regulator of sirC expression with transglutaminase-like and TPR domain
MRQSREAKFAEITSGPDEDIDLAAATLQIARREYPDLDPIHYLHRLDDMAAACRAPSPGAVPEVLEAMNGYLFGAYGLRGDLQTFNDPRNSFLNQVLDRKLGIPISLSLVYMEIGARLGLEIRGISFPGHFLVRVGDSEAGLVLDPFAGGAVLDRKELRRRLLNYPAEQRRGWDLEQLLVPASRREILARMLRNLKAIYVNRKDFRRALEIVNMMLDLYPEAAGELRDRALIYDQMDCLHAAIESYEQYLDLCPDAEETEYVRDRLLDLRHSVQRLH